MEKQKKIPKLRFPEFSDGWNSRKIKEVATITSGTTPSRSNKLFFEDGNIPWVKTTDLNNSSITITEECVTEYAVNNTSLKINPVNSVLVAMYGGFNQIGRTGILEVEATTNQALSVLKANTKIVSPKYILFWLNHNIHLWRKYAVSSRKDPNITGSDVSSFPIRFPSITEQQKIASFFTAIDQKISQLKSKKTLLEQYKKGVMQKIFSREIRFKDDNGQEFPKWEKKKFKDCLVPLSTRNFQIKSTSFNPTGRYKVIDQGKELIAGYSDNDDLVFKNTPIIVFGDHTTILKYIDFEFIVGADGTKLLKNKTGFDLKYLYYNLSFNNISQEGYKRHFSILSKVILQIPTFSEQTKIANFLSAIDVKINHTQKQIEKAEVWKKGLMQQMFV